MPPLIYLYEDDASLAELLTEVVQDDLGGVVVACTSIGALREHCARRRPDLIIADFWGASHMRLAEAERVEIAEVGSIAPALLVSGRAWARDVSPDDLGVWAVLSKPLDMERFVGVVRTAITACVVGQP